MKQTLRALLAASLLGGALADSKSCPADSPLSCKGDEGGDTCCYNTPGGLLLLTQFWDAKPAKGPDDSWTIHGLWPDNCDGTYESNCDKKREINNQATEILKSGSPETLEYLNTYWKDNSNDDEKLWEHEWNKHGTCISTMEKKCYESYKDNDDIIDYYKKAVELHKKLKTHKVLADAGISPDDSKTYSLKDMQAAISKAHGSEVTINCRSGAISEIWYFYNVKGSAQTGEYVPASPAGAKSSCPKDGIKYPPKSGGGNYSIAI